MLIAELTPLQPLIETIRHFATVFIRCVQCIVIGIAALEMSEPNRFAVCTGCEHIVNTVDTLKPIETAISAQLVVLNPIHDIARDAPHTIRAGHSAGCLLPCAVVVCTAEHTMLCATELRKYHNIEVAFRCVFLINRELPHRCVLLCVEVCERLIASCYKLVEVAVVECAVIVAVNILEAEYRCIAFVLVPITLCMKVALQIRCCVCAVLVSAEECDRNAVDRRVERVRRCAVVLRYVSVLRRCAIV